MKKISTFALLALSLMAGITAKGQVGINTTNPDVSAVLDIVSTDKGLLIPRLTMNQRNNIGTPANGLLVYQTDNTPGFYYYNGSIWQQIAAGGNYVDLTTAQTIGGQKTFTSDINVNGVTVGRGNGAVASNTTLGTGALAANTTGFQNTAIGGTSLNRNTTGYYNVALGQNSLYLNTVGHRNTAIGTSALVQNTSGAYNTATGSVTLSANTVGQFNTATGAYALSANTTGNNNTASGSEALTANSAGSQNTATGTMALYQNTTGNSNTATGSRALYRSTTGSQNTANGFFALSNNIDGYNNTALGYLADVTVGNLTNATVIGYNAKVDASNKVQIGDANVTAVKLGGTSAVLETSQIKLTGGSPGANKVLTSDAAGLATWQTPTSGTSSKKRSVILDVASLDATSEMSGIPGTKKMIGGWARPVLMLPDGSATQFQTQIPIPADWNGTSSFTVTVLYSSPSTSADFSTALFFLTSGLNASTVTGTSGFVGVAPESATADGLMEVSYIISAAATDKLLFLTFRRGQDPAADTSASEMDIHGVRIDYFD